jgi:DNA-binding NtrC family response regulator
MVTDFCLPRGNGCELAIEVKRLYPKVKILLISGDPGVIPIGEVSFLAKPCRLRALVDAARAALGPGAAAAPVKLH